MSWDEDREQRRLLIGTALWQSVDWDRTRVGDVNALADGMVDYLDAVLDEERAKLWDRGYTAGHSNAMRRMSDEPDAPTSPNPYRGAEHEGGP